MNEPLGTQSFWRSFRIPIGVAAYLLIATACVPSGKPDTEELIKTRVPTFSNSSAASFTTSTPTFALNGECDPISKGLEYSFDNSTWVSLASGCNAGAFTLNVTVNNVLRVYVRAKTKLGQTDASIATIRLLLPPTAPAYQFVTAGSSVAAGTAGVQFTMSGSTTGEHSQNANHRIDTHVTGVVYAQ